MQSKEYGCKDCERAFLVREEEKEPKCPGCESKNIAPKEKRPLPEWMCKVQSESG
jgi:DNA-directed RNA polymerase subunit RPC12/RpoP